MIPHCIKSAAAPVTKGVMKDVPVTASVAAPVSGCDDIHPGATRSGFT